MSVSMIGPKFYAWGRDGLPLAFGKLYTYKARTNAPKDTYQSEDGIVANTNPVILNGEGYANVYLDGSYKVVLKDADDNEIWSEDPVTAQGGEEWVNCQAVTYLSPTSFKITGNVIDKYTPGRAVRIDNTAVEYSYSVIDTVVFSAGETTVTVFDSVVLVGVIGVCASIIGAQQSDLGVTIEKAKTLNYLKGQLVTTIGYSLENDGGGADYVVVASDTGTPDGGSYIDMDNGFRLELIQGSSLNVMVYGVTGDGVTDDYIQTQAALDALRQDQVLVISRPLAISQTLIKNADTQIEFTGNGKLVAMVGFTGGVMLEIAGSLTQLPALFNDVTLGDSVVGFDTLPDLEENDVFIIYNPTAYSWSGYRAEYKAGEFCRVHGRSGNNIDVWGELYDSYLKVDVDIYKVNPVKVILTNPHFEGNDVDNLIGCRIAMGVDTIIANPVTSKTSIAGIEFDRCYGVLVDASSVKVNAPVAGNQYGIIFANCHDFKLHGSLYATRHSIGIGGGAGIGAVTNRLGRISDSNLYGLKSTGVPTGDMHGNVEDIWYSDCIFRNGAQLAGKNVGLKSCVIYGVADSGVCVLGAEVIGGEHTLDNCELITNVSTLTRGVVYITASEFTNEPLRLIARDNTIKATNQPSTWSCFYIANNGSTESMSAFIDGVQAFGNDFAAILRMELLLGTAGSEGFVVDNVYCNQAGSWLMFPDGDYDILPVLRLQTQKGVNHETTVAASAALIGAPKTFRYLYPRSPSGSVTASGANGATLGAIGAFAGIAQMYQVTNLIIRPAIVTYNVTDLWGGVVDIDLHWSVGISEV